MLTPYECPQYKLDFKSLFWTKVIPNNLITGDLISAVPTPKYFTTLTVYNGSLYVFGGMLGEEQGSNVMNRFDIRSNTWYEVQHAPGSSPPPKLNGCSAVVHGDCMFVFGGFNHSSGKFSNSLYQFNFKTSTWSNVKTTFANAPHPIPTPKHTSSQSQDGSSATSASTTNAIGSSVNNATPTVPFRRAYHTAVIHGDDMYIFGGKKPASIAEKEESVFQLNFTEMKWFERPSCDDIGNVFFHQSIVHKDNMYVIGGNDRNNRHYNFYAFDLKQHQWSMVESERGNARTICRNILQKLMNASTLHDTILRATYDGHHREFCVHRAIISQCHKLEVLMKNHSQGFEELKIEDGGFQEQDEAHAATPSSSSAMQSRQHTSSILTIEVCDIHPDVLQQVLFFVYGSDNIRIRRSLLVDLMHAAKQYELQDLYDRCLNFVDDHITDDNVLHMIQKSHRTDLYEVKAKCLQYIRAHYDSVVDRDEMELLDSPVMLDIARLKSNYDRVQRSLAELIERERLQQVQREKSMIKQRQRLQNVHQKYIDVLMLNDSGGSSAMKALLSHLLHLRMTGAMADIVLFSQGKRFAAHKAVLVSQCQYFATFLDGHWEDAQHTELDMSDQVSPQVLVHILDFIYTGRLQRLCSENSRPVHKLLFELASAADMLLFKELEKISHELITSMVQPSNIVEILQLCSAYESSPKLKEAIKISCRNILTQMELERVVDMFIGCWLS